MVRFLFSLLCLLMCADIVWAGPIYVFKEKDGTIRFTTSAPPAGTEAKVFTGRKAGFSMYKVGGYRNYRSGRLFRNLYTKPIELASRSFGLESSLIKAVIHVESAFDPWAVSRKGARGLMQLMPGTARIYGVRNIHSPEQNIYAGSKHLAFLIRKYNGNLKLALAAYNAGSGAVEKYGGIPPYSETRNYVQRVMSLQSRYSALS